MSNNNYANMEFEASHEQWKAKNHFKLGRSLWKITLEMKRKFSKG
jgi:hypothetical protein